MSRCVAKSNTLCRRDIIHIVILSVLSVIVVIIYYWNRNPNANDGMNMNMNMCNVISPFENYLPKSDLHFIIDPDISNILNPISNFKLIQEDNMSLYINVFQHKSIDIHPFKYRPLAQYCHVSIKPLNDDDIVKLLHESTNLHIITSSNIIPKRMESVWVSNNLTQDNGQKQTISIWHPQPQVGTATMGDIICIGNKEPDDDMIPCLPYSMVKASPMSGGVLWFTQNNEKQQCYCWKATEHNFFRCTTSYSDKMLELDRVYNIPKTILDNNTIPINSRP